MKNIFLFAFVSFYSLIGFCQTEFYSINYNKFPKKKTKDAYTPYAYASIGLKDNANMVKLPFKEKTKEQLYQALLAYGKEKSFLRLSYNEGVDKGRIEFKDFVTLGTKENCMADLYALTFLEAFFYDRDYIGIRINLRKSKIYATVSDAKLKLTPNDDVASLDDTPFNEFKFIQPSNEEIMFSYGYLFGLDKKNLSIKLAYPDSIFDIEGNIINPYNKSLIEKYYDKHILDLKAFLENYFIEN